MQIKLFLSAKKPVSDFVFGIGIFNTEGVCCYGTNTYIEEYEPLECKGPGEVTFQIDQLNLIEGTYYLDVAAHRRDEYPYDYHRHLYTFKVRSRTKKTLEFFARTIIGNSRPTLGSRRLRIRIKDSRDSIPHSQFSHPRLFCLESKL